MNRKSITFKLFIVTTVLLLTLVTLFMFTESLFFEKFYYKQKTKNLTQSVEKLKQTYMSDQNLNKDLYEYAYKFEEENNAQIAFLNKSGVIKYIKQPIKHNSEVDSKEVIIMAIKNWVSYEKSYFDVILSKKSVHFNFKNPILNTNNLVVVSPIVVDDEITDILFVISTLQPIGEASSVIKIYYLYAYLIVIIIIAVLSLFYSKIISKPLIEVNKIANKMASLDFSTKCTVKSEDEIGTLSNNLNFLSTTLDNTLKKLNKANEELKADIEKERALEKLRKEFIAGVSHELKTPISLIEGYSEGLKDGIVDEVDKEFYLDVIIDETKKMNTLVMNMLELSKLESGTFSLNIKPFLLFDLIDKIYKKYKNTESNRIFYLQFNIQKETIVLGDIFKIESVLENIINNAIKYSDENTTIFITIQNHNSLKNKVIIDIENQGDQIPQKELDFIWEKFYRVDKSRNKYLGGTGLGLSIVKNILILHESDFDLKNTKTGVKFFFTLNKQL